MRTIRCSLLLSGLVLLSTVMRAQKLEHVYLSSKDTASNRYIAVIPEKVPVKAWMFLLDGFGASPENVLMESTLPKYAATQGILTVIPLLSTGSLYFGSDDASQRSLKEQIEGVAKKYGLKDKPFFIGGFSIGGTCAIKYAELAVNNNYPFKPKAAFGIDPPLDWEHYYRGAERVIHLSGKEHVNQEVAYMIDRIKKEIKGTPEQALGNFYANSPYSFSDTTQSAVKLLAGTPVMLVSEPDLQWWLKERGYDLAFINIADDAGFINELKHLGNKNAVLVTTFGKGYREPGHVRHPHSWSIADSSDVVQWLFRFSRP
ncbi:alpha/beta-hydrolase superfamily protein [Mucilaginibacter paludis DSM 18603]|uniref:Alpha/beta-hydrolase superfamily protein n=2 Tax=Mucilaginibacter TaxID=423349 RepID=H1Y8W0_9SPHI|nr:alpha/beta-hydrolase superfamily protein [Mucilaginibacter paludis DSM 18603]